MKWPHKRSPCYSSSDRESSRVERHGCFEKCPSTVECIGPSKGALHRFKSTWAFLCATFRSAHTARKSPPFGGLFRIRTNRFQKHSSEKIFIPEGINGPHKIRESPEDEPVQAGTPGKPLRCKPRPRDPIFSDEYFQRRRNKTILSDRTITISESFCFCKTIYHFFNLMSSISLPLYPDRPGRSDFILKIQS